MTLSFIVLNMLDFVPKKVYLQGILLHYFIQQKSAWIPMVQSFCIWWDQLGVVYYELFKPTETIKGNCRLLKLMCLSWAIKKKWPLSEQRHNKVILQHNSAWLHVSKWRKAYLEMLKWEVLPCSPYSPDIAPSDHHLLQSMAHGLAEPHFHSYEDAKNCVDLWLTSKDVFFRCGIQMLPEGWEKSSG